MSDEKRSSRIREFAENLLSTVENSFSLKYFISTAAISYTVGIAADPIYTPCVIAAGIVGYAFLSPPRGGGHGKPPRDGDDDGPGPDIDPDLTNLGPRRGRDISLDEAEDISRTTPLPDRQRQLQPS